MKLLITGGSGFVGKNLGEYFSTTHEVFNPNSHELNLLDTAAVAEYLKHHQFDVIIHCAADAVSRDYSKNISAVVQNNLLMFFNLERNEDYFGRMLHFGSGAGYDRRHYKPRMREEYFGTYIPLDEYGLSKYVIGKYTEHVPKTYELRLFGVFGKYENWRIRFISNNICRALYDIDLSMNQNVKFDYLYIDDVCRIVEGFISKKKLKYHTYNLCSGKSVDLLSLANRIVVVSGKKLKIRIKKTGMGVEYSGNNSRLKTEFPSLQLIPIDQAIEELYRWYRDNKKLIKKQDLFFDQ